MSEWRENHNGNFVYVDDGVVTTVFKRSDGEWYGIREGMITEEGFDDPESAMEAIDEEWSAHAILAGYLQRRVAFTDRTRPASLR